MSISWVMAVIAAVSSLVAAVLLLIVGEPRTALWALCSRGSVVNTGPTSDPVLRPPMPDPGVVLQAISHAIYTAGFGHGFYFSWKHPSTQSNTPSVIVQLFHTSSNTEPLAEYKLTLKSLPSAVEVQS